MPGSAQMGTFGTAEEALQNVAAFRAASAAKPRKEKADRGKNSKAVKDGKVKKHKSHKRKEHSSKSEGKRSHKHARASSDDDSGSSASDAEVTPTVQLERGRRAAHSMRHLLHYFPAVRQDLREANFQAKSLLRNHQTQKLEEFDSTVVLTAGYSLTSDCSVSLFCQALATFELLQAIKHSCERACADELHASACNNQP